MKAMIRFDPTQTADFTKTMIAAGLASYKFGRAPPAKEAVWCVADNEAKTFDCTSDDGAEALVLTGEYKVFTETEDFVKDCILDLSPLDLLTATLRSREMAKHGPEIARRIRDELGKQAEQPRTPEEQADYDACKAAEHVTRTYTLDAETTMEISTCMHCAKLAAEGDQERLEMFCNTLSVRALLIDFVAMHEASKAKKH